MFNGSHKDIMVDKNGEFLCASSPMFKKLAEEKFYHQRKMKLQQKDLTI